MRSVMPAALRVHACHASCAARWSAEAQPRRLYVAVSSRARQETARSGGRRPARAPCRRWAQAGWVGSAELDPDAVQVALVAARAVVSGAARAGSAAGRWGATDLRAGDQGASGSGVDSWGAPAARAGQAGADRSGSCVGGSGAAGRHVLVNLLVELCGRVGHESHALLVKRAVEHHVAAVGARVPRAAAVQVGQVLPAAQTLPAAQAQQAATARAPAGGPTPRWSSSAVADTLPLP